MTFNNKNIFETDTKNTEKNCFNKFQFKRQDSMQVAYPDKLHKKKGSVQQIANLRPNSSINKIKQSSNRSSVHHLDVVDKPTKKDKNLMENSRLITSIRKIVFNVNRIIYP